MGVYKTSYFGFVISPGSRRVVDAYSRCQIPKSGQFVTGLETTAIDVFCDQIRNEPVCWLSPVACQPFRPALQFKGIHASACPSFNS